MHKNHQQHLPGTFVVLEKEEHRVKVLFCQLNRSRIYSEDVFYMTVLSMQRIGSDERFLIFYTYLYYRLCTFIGRR